jgi:hypothetical protein
MVFALPKSEGTYMKCGKEPQKTIGGVLFGFSTRVILMYSGLKNLKTSFNTYRKSINFRNS